MEDNNITEVMKEWERWVQSATLVVAKAYLSLRGELKKLGVKDEEAQAVALQKSLSVHDFLKMAIREEEDLGWIDDLGVGDNLSDIEKMWVEDDGELQGERE